MDSGRRAKVPSARLEKPGIQPTMPGLQGEWLSHLAMEAFELSICMRKPTI